jgi:hypothetical protein
VTWIELAIALGVAIVVVWILTLCFIGGRR